MLLLHPETLYNKLAIKDLFLKIFLSNREMKDPREIKNALEARFELASPCGRRLSIWQFPGLH